MTEILRPSFVLLGHSTSLSANGTPAIWLMDGTNLLSTAMAGSLNPGMDWQVIAQCGAFGIGYLRGRYPLALDFAKWPGFRDASLPQA